MVTIRIQIRLVAWLIGRHSNRATCPVTNRRASTDPCRARWSAVIVARVVVVYVQLRVVEIRRLTRTGFVPNDSSPEVLCHLEVVKLPCRAIPGLPILTHPELHPIPHWASGISVFVHVCIEEDFFPPPVSVAVRPSYSRTRTDLCVRESWRRCQHNGCKCDADHDYDSTQTSCVSSETSN